MDESQRVEHTPSSSQYPSGNGTPGTNFVFRVIAMGGDLNNDNKVDLIDLNSASANFGVSSGAAYQQGDIDGDGAIGLIDLSLLKDNFDYDWKSF